MSKFFRDIILLELKNNATASFVCVCVLEPLSSELRGPILLSPDTKVWSSGEFDGVCDGWCFPTLLFVSAVVNAERMFVLELFSFRRLWVDAANHSHGGGCIPSKLLHAPGVGDRMQPYTSLQEPNLCFFGLVMTHLINFPAYEVVGGSALCGSQMIHKV